MSRIVVMEAMQFTDETKNACAKFVTCNCSYGFDDSGAPEIKIQTTEGVMTASIGDYIVKDVNGEFYPCERKACDKVGK